MRPPGEKGDRQEVCLPGLGHTFYSFLVLDGEPEQESDAPHRQQRAQLAKKCGGAGAAPSRFSHLSQLKLWPGWPQPQPQLFTQILSPMARAGPSCLGSVPWGPANLGTLGNTQVGAVLGDLG